MTSQSVTYVWILLALITAYLSAVSAFGLGGIPLPPAFPPTQTANATGTYQVGLIAQSHAFQGSNFTFYWFYPALPVCGSNPYISAGGIQGQAVQNAPLNRSGGPYPLIFFSPGLGAYADAYYFYTQNLASQGYIVVSVENLDTKTALPTTDPALVVLADEYQAADDGSAAVETLYTEWFRSTQFALTYRPHDIEFGLNTVIRSGLNPDSPFFAAFDPTNIGMSGHSLGAFYTLIMGGGMPLYCNYPMTPAELNSSNPILVNVSVCAFPDRQIMPGPFALKDFRIKAIIPLAPPFFIQDSQIARSAAKINIPMMIITGDDLQPESTRAPQYATFQNASGDSYWVMVSKTSHYLVGDAYQLNPVFSATLPVNDRADFVEKAAVYMTYSTAFFDLYLKGDRSAEVKLHSVSSPFVADLQYHE